MNKNKKNTARHKERFKCISKTDFFFVKKQIQ